MPDRTFTYTFKGNFTSLAAGLTTMSKGAQDLGTQLTALDKAGAASRRGLTSIGSTAGKVGLVAAAGLAAVVTTAANFEQAMSRVKAATGASSQGLEQLRSAAIKAGAATVFSASDAADAITAMSKAGVSAGDILAGGLDGALALASAGELDVGQAAEIAATAMNQFGLAGKDITHIADLLAAGAASAQGEVTDFAEALKFVGPVAHQMNISIEETTGVIAELAAQGVVGSQAGTSLRGMLTSLTSPSIQAQKEMKALGISLYDATGNFVGFEGVAQQLQGTLGGLTNAERDQALGRIFGNEQITAARILYAGGADAVEKWTAAVDKDGAAADIAATKLDNLRGDLEQLKGSLETAFIGAGTGSQGPLRKLTQDATAAVNVFNKMPSSLQGTATAMLGITAITGGGLWFGSRVVQGIASTNQALENLGKTGDRLRGVLKGVAAAAAGLVALEVAGGVITALDKAAEKAAPNVERLTAALIAADNEQFSTQFGDIKDSLDAIDPSGLKGVLDTVNSLADKGGLAGRALETGLSGFAGGSAELDRVRHSADEAAASLGSLDAALANIATTGSADQARQAFDSLVKSQGLSADEQKTLLSQLPQYQDALQSTANAAALGAGATGALTAQTGGLAGAADDASNGLDGMVKSMQDARDAAVAGFDAITGYRQAMKDATKQAHASAAGIAGSSDAALKNREVLGNLAASWNGLDQTVTDNISKFKEAKANFIATAVAMGVPKKVAEQLADTLLKIPTSQVTQFSTPGLDESTSKARTLKEVMDSLHNKDIYVALHYQTIGNKPDAPVPGDPNSRTSSRSGLRVRTPSTSELSGGKAAAAAATLGLLAARGALHEWTAEIIGSTHSAHNLKDKLDKAQQALDAETSHLEALTSARDSLASSVSGKFDVDLGAQPSNVWAANTGGLLATIAKITQQAQALPGIIAALKAAGLTGQALQEALQEMDFSHLAALAADPTQAGQLGAALAALYQARATAGNAAGDAVYKPDIDAVNNNLQDLKDQVRELRKDVRQADKNNTDAQANNAYHVVEGVNDAASNGHRRRGHGGRR